MPLKKIKSIKTIVFDSTSTTLDLKFFGKFKSELVLLFKTIKDAIQLT